MALHQKLIIFTIKRLTLMLSTSASFNVVNKHGYIARHWVTQSLKRE
jgi:hypothetical protein